MLFALDELEFLLDEDDELDEDDDEDDDDYADDDEVDDEISGTGGDGGYENKDQKIYEARDGLIHRHPKDDSPNDYKVGWLTIYEKGRYFEKVAQGGNWQMVLGLTFAIGFEKMIDKYLKELEEVV